MGRPARAERAALISRAARVLEDNRAEFESWLVREGGAVPGKAAFEVGLVLGELWEAAALPTQPWGHLLATAEPGRRVRRPAAAARRGRCHQPVELPADPLGPRGGAGAGAGQRGHPEAGCADGVSGGVLIARLFEEAGLPGGLLHVLPGDAEAGAALALEPERRDDLVHRLDGRRPAGRRGRGPYPQARRAGAGRQQRAHRARRRRRRRRQFGRGVERVPAPGPDLHDRGPAHRARGRGRGVPGAARRAGREPARRRPLHRAGRARAADQRAAAGQRRPHRHRDRRRRRHRARGRHPRAAVLPADRARRRHPRACLPSARRSSGRSRRWSW